MTEYKKKQLERIDSLIALLQDVEPNTRILRLRNKKEPWKQEILAEFKLDCPEIPKLNRRIHFYLTIIDDCTRGTHTLKKAVSIVQSTFSEDKTKAFRGYLTNIFMNHLQTIPLPEIP